MLFDDVGLGARAVRWPAAAAFTAAAVAWISTDLLSQPRAVFVLAYLLAAAVLSAVFLRTGRASLLAAAGRNPVRAAAVTAIVTSVAVGTVLVQPGAPHAQGGRLVLELAWDGVVYGAVDGVLLTVVPIAAVRHVLGERGGTSHALALLASCAVFFVYHLGFSEFRGAAIAGPLASGLLFGAAYLISRNPVVPVVAHVAMHVAAVLHGPAGTMQLPPHY